MRSDFQLLVERVSHDRSIEVPWIAQASSLTLNNQLRFQNTRPRSAFWQLMNLHREQRSTKFIWISLWREFLAGFAFKLPYNRYQELIIWEFPSSTQPDVKHDKVLGNEKNTHKCIDTFPWIVQLSSRKFKTSLQFMKNNATAKMLKISESMTGLTCLSGVRQSRFSFAQFQKAPEKCPNCHIFYL